MKPAPVITIHSSHGDIHFDARGLLLNDELDCEEFPQEDHPFRLDVTEWENRPDWTATAGEWDILDWSYWTRLNAYEPAILDWRSK